MVVSDDALDSRRPSQTTAVDHPLPSRDFDPKYEVKWDGPDDKNNPYNWSEAYRWYITFLGAILVLNATFASSAPSETIPSYIRYFGISQEVGVLTISIFLCGYIAGPLIWGPLSEQFGRRPVFLISFLPYVGWNVGCALSPNIGALLAFRFLGGTFAAAPLSNSGALIADIWDARRRGLGLSIFALAPFAGPALGPTIGGAIETAGVSWRIVYWTLTGFAGACFLALLFTMPETYAPILLKKKAKKMRKETGDDRYWAPMDKQETDLKSLAHRVLLKPFIMIAQEPMLAAITLYMSFVYGIVYLLFEAIPFVFSRNHGFSPLSTGLTFLAIFVGGLAATIGYIFGFSPHYNKLADKYAPRMVPPEKRLYQTMLAAILFPIAMFWLGWTGQYPSVSYWVPLVALGVLGGAVLMLFLSLFNYLIDTYLFAAATALSINTVCRSIAGAAFPLFATQMYERLDVNWASSLLGFLSLVCVPIPFVLYKFGPKIRAMSKHAPTLPGAPAKSSSESSDKIRTAEKVAPSPAAESEPTKAETFGENETRPADIEAQMGDEGKRP